MRGRSRKKKKPGTEKVLVGTRLIKYTIVQKNNSDPPLLFTLWTLLYRSRLTPGEFTFLSFEIRKEKKLNAYS